MLVPSQKPRPFIVDFTTHTGKNQLQLGQMSVVTLFFANKSLIKTDRCAGALSLRRNQLSILHFSGRFFLTATKDVNVHFFIHRFYILQQFM